MDTIEDLLNADEEVKQPEVQPPIDETQNMSIGEVARFFDKSVPWVRWCERMNYFQREDGTLIEPARTTPRRAENGYRKYSLKDIAEMAESLFRKNKINQIELRIIRTKVAAFSVEV